MRQLFLGLIFVLSLFTFAEISAAEKSDIVEISIERSSSGYEIKFLSNKPLDAAVFLNGTRLWFIVEGEIDRKRIDSRSNDIIKNISTLEKKDGYSIGFFDIIQPHNYEITSVRKDNNLVIRINPYDNSVLSDELSTRRKLTKNIGIKDNSVDIELNDINDKVLAFTESVTGEKFFVVLEKISTRTADNTFVDFEIVESLSGVVIKSLNDSLVVSVNGKKIIVSSKNYLNISSDISKNQNRVAGSTLKFDLESDTILDLSMYNTKPEDFALTLSKINSAIYNAYDNSIKAEAFLNLSLFFLANQWYLEAKSALELVNRYSDIISESYKVKMIVAAIYFMSDAFTEANDIISSIDIKSVNIKDRSEIRFWKNVCGLFKILNHKSSQDNELINLSLKKISTKLIDRKNNFLRKYNDRICNKVASKVGDISISVNRPDILRAVVISMSRNKIDSYEKKDLDYLNGKLLISYNDKNQALESFKSCMSNVKDRYYYSKCKFEALKILYETGKFTKSEYINNLQGLSTVWRGDGFELDVLERLADFYHENNYIADAIRTWKNISTSYPGSYIALTNATKAGKAFTEYFKDSSDTKLEKLGFFYEFQDLIPLGDEGDKIIMQTASYMLDLDMVDQAIKVIDYQIKNRLIGISREETINDLVKVYIDAKHYDAAEDAIVSFSKMPLNIINPVIADRKYLYVDALIGSGQMEDAIAMLYGDSSVRADELRTKAFFKLEDWNSFNDNSEPYLYSIRYTKEKNLSDNDYIKILKQNISYFNQGNMQFLNDLYLDMKPNFRKGQKNAERNRIFYNLANELKTSSEMTPNKKTRIKELIDQIVKS